jgi:hypothetical protein
VEAYFREFAHAARHVKRAALLLRRRLVHAQRPPTGTGTSNGRPAGSQRSWSSALLLPRLRWLRPSDPVHTSPPPSLIAHHVLELARSFFVSLLLHVSRQLVSRLIDWLIGCGGGGVAGVGGSNVA